MKKGKKILIALLLLIVLGSVIGYFQWNKPHPKVEDQKGIELKANALFTAFSTNEATANKTYLNKVVDVNGTIQEVSKNQDGKTVVILGADDPIGGVQCTFRDDVTVKAGDNVILKGFCNGYTDVVLLNDCVLSK